MTRVLVVDDEAPIRRALSANLRARGYDVDVAATGEQALDLAAHHHPDIVLLDLGLPGMDGREVIDGLRGWSAVPIVVLSARGSERDKVRRARRRSRRLPVQAVRHGRAAGPRAGGAAARHAGGRGGDRHDGALHVDLADKRVIDRDGTTIRLTPTEWHLLEVLVRHAGKLVGQRQLLQDVWGPQYGDESNYLRVHLAHLRAKLEPDRSHPRYLITEPGMGYRFVP